MSKSRLETTALIAEVIAAIAVVLSCVDGSSFARVNLVSF